MPQDITRAFTAISLPTSSLILHCPLAVVSAIQSDSNRLSSSPPQSTTRNLDSALVEAELSPLLLSLSSPCNNLPEDLASVSATELDTPTSIEFNPSFNFNFNLYSNSDSDSDTSYSTTSFSASQSRSSLAVSSTSSTQASSAASITTPIMSSSVVPIITSTAFSAVSSSASSDASTAVTVSTISPAVTSTTSTAATSATVTTSTSSDSFSFSFCSASSSPVTIASDQLESPTREYRVGHRCLALSEIAADQNTIRVKQFRGLPWILEPELREELFNIITESVENFWKSLKEIVYMAGIQTSSKTLYPSLALDEYHGRVARNKPFLNCEHVSVSHVLFLIDFSSYNKFT
ncbi:hypothetical protein HOY82DRAFT_535955 [Tuber indicum]|nr:hypothetical protein HOY82DRAFT_535955 [Tuber indicum]